MDMQISNRDQRLNLSSPTSTPENSISSFSCWRTLRTPETVVFSPIHVGVNAGESRRTFFFQMLPDRQFIYKVHQYKYSTLRCFEYFFQISSKMFILEKKKFLWNYLESVVYFYSPPIIIWYIFRKLYIKGILNPKHLDFCLLQYNHILIKIQ